MLSRRNFIKSGLVVGGTGVLGVKGAIAKTEECQYPHREMSSERTGHLVVISANTDRMPFLREGPRDSMLTVVCLESGIVVDESYIPTRVTNAHDIVPFSATGMDSRYIVVGKGCRAIAHILGTDFESLAYIRVPGITFRGHGIQYEDDVLVTAELTESPMDGGKLLRITPDGVVKSMHNIGGLRPHHIVDAGDYFAVANYGDRPFHMAESEAVRGMSADSSPTQDQHFFDVLEPSITLLDKESLELVKKIDSPSKVGALTHLDTTSDGTIYAVLNQGLVFSDKETAFSYFSANRVSVPIYEKLENIYNFSLPLVKANVDGVVSVIDVGGDARDAQSVATDYETGIAVFTFPGSHLIKIIGPSGDISDIDSRAFGISQPRGCSKLDGQRNLFIVTGNDNSATIFDALSKTMVAIIPASFSDHSHCRWIS